MASDERGLVLVTGGSGYLAGFCIAQLLKEGWAVRTTVRQLSREPEVRTRLAQLVEPVGRLAFVPADLDSDTGWAEAVAGCAFVLHVASPLPARNPRDDEELTRPARDGALRVLRRARDAGARRVVMTASTASIAYGHGGRSEPFTEADWSDETNRADTSAYERSKTIAERAAWDFIRRDGGALELATINPGLILGPVLGKDFSASVESVKRLMDGSLPGIPRFGWPIVDVRDVADLHCRALLNPAAAGERFIAAGPFYWMADIARVLRSRLPERARRVPTRTLPDWLVRAASLFDPIVRGRLFELGKMRPVSSEKAKQLLGWSPRPNDEAIVATAESLIALGVVAT
jgi:dihydroflavonol-4-reductase